MEPKKTIHDIFSFKDNIDKFQNDNPIIIDIREKNSLVASELLELKAKIKFEFLEIADYIINDIAIERKTFSDLFGSMINKRLNIQLKEIKKYPKHFLLVENFDFDYKIQNRSSLKGLLLSIVLDYQIPIIFTKDEKDTAEFLLLLAKKQEKEKTATALRQFRTLETIQEQKQFILEGFPGIGPKTAEKLISKFKTLGKIFSASEQELKDAGLNQIKINKLREVLND